MRRYSRGFNFRGMKAVVAERVPKRSRYTFYGIKHSEDDWDDPITVEPFVFVNRWGAIGFESPLEHSMFGEDGYIELSEDEKDVLREAMESLYQRRCR